MRISKKNRKMKNYNEESQKEIKASDIKNKETEKKKLK